MESSCCVVVKVEEEGEGVVWLRGARVGEAVRGG